MKNTYIILLGLIFFLSLTIRGIIPYLTSGISFHGNDPFYNFRLVESVLHNFPHRIYFDAYTFYPHGTSVPFAPLFDYLLAAIIWVLGLGSPYTVLGEQGVKTIFAWYPAVLGALCVFPVYLIGKELWNRNAGLIGALIIAILPGQILSRSLLGFTDHHIMEVLLSTTAMLCLFMAIRVAKNQNITFEALSKHSWKKPFFYAILSGIALSLYFIGWNGAPLFVFLLLFYVLIQYVVDHLRNQNTDYLTFVFGITFAITIITVLPFLFTPYEGFARFQIISLVLGLVVFITLGLLSKLLSKKQIDPKAYPLVIVVLALVSYILLSVFVPSLHQELLSKLNIFFPSGGALTIQEVSSMGIPHIWRWFSTAFFVAFLGLWFVMRNIRVHKRPEEILFLVWSLFILFACFGQNRFAYYYAVNVALLCGVASWKLIELVTIKKVENKRTKGKTKKAKPKENEVWQKYKVPITCVLLFLVVVVPPLNTSLKVVKYSGSIPSDWYDALTWMRNNTPDPGVDYYGLYEAPHEGDDYDYPDSAYGVMSWWDYGHWITTIAHRIPIANPFQQGAHVAAEYLISTNETEANKILDELGVKYVVTDFPIVNFMGAPTNPNPKYVMPVWTGKNPNPLHTMGVRLHFFNGNETKINNETIIPSLECYELVYESNTYVLPYMVVDTNTNRIVGWFAFHGSYDDAIKQAEVLHQGARVNENLVAQTPEFMMPFAFVKIFRYGGVDE